MLKQIFVKDFNNFMDHAVSIRLAKFTDALDFYVYCFVGRPRNDTSKDFQRAFPDEGGDLENK
jgi:hypothetical protein